MGAIQSSRHTPLDCVLKNWGLLITILKAVLLKCLRLPGASSSAIGGCTGAGGPRGAIPRSRSEGAAVRR